VTDHEIEDWSAKNIDIDLSTTILDDDALASLWDLFQDTSTATQDWRAIDQPTHIEAAAISCMGVAPPTTLLVEAASTGGEHVGTDQSNLDRPSRSISLSPREPRHPSQPNPSLTGQASHSILANRSVSVPLLFNNPPLVVYQ
jgi:hypothetical protein